MRPEHLYLHVPFCMRRCPYCDFAVTVDRQPAGGAWIDAIRLELEAVLARWGWARIRPRTVYLGGGTPSLLGGEAAERLRDALAPLVAWDQPRLEWTAEANPESFTDEVAAGWRRAGINRVSMGVQTFHPPTLRWMGRMHGPEGAVRAFDIARDHGFDNVGMDLIFAVPDRLNRDWGRDLDSTLELRPEHVSLYGLSAERGTPLGCWVESGREVLPADDGYADQYLEASTRLTRAGYAHYEVSNFALPGRESVHNGAYWSGAAYIGLGPSAHSFLPPERSWNLRDWAAYREAVRNGRSPVEGRERVEGAAERIERIWLGLRTSRGVPAEMLRQAGAAGGESARTVREWGDRGWLDAYPGAEEYVRLSPAGWLVLDRITVEVEEMLAATESSPGAVIA